MMSHQETEMKNYNELINNSTSDSIWWQLRLNDDQLYTPLSIVNWMLRAAVYVLPSKLISTRQVYFPASVSEAASSLMKPFSSTRKGLPCHSTGWQSYTQKHTVDILYSTVDIFTVTPKEFNSDGPQNGHKLSHRQSFDRILSQGFCPPSRKNTEHVAAKLQGDLLGSP